MKIKIDNDTIITVDGKTYVHEYTSRLVLDRGIYIDHHKGYKMYIKGNCVIRFGGDGGIYYNDFDNNRYMYYSLDTNYET